MAEQQRRRLGGRRPLEADGHAGDRLHQAEDLARSGRALCAPGARQKQRALEQDQDVRGLVFIEDVRPGGELPRARHAAEPGDGRHPVDAQSERLAQGQHPRDQVQPHGRRRPGRPWGEAGAAELEELERELTEHRAGDVTVLLEHPEQRIGVEHQDHRPRLGHEVNGEHHAAEHRERAHAALRSGRLDDVVGQPEAAGERDVVRHRALSGVAQDGPRGERLLASRGREHGDVLDRHLIEGRGAAQPEHPLGERGRILVRHGPAPRRARAAGWRPRRQRPPPRRSSEDPRGAASRRRSSPARGRGRA